MTELTTVEVSRTWPMARKYEVYRVTIRVPVTGEGDKAVLAAARYAAKNAHVAWGEYKAEYENMEQDRGSFERASETAHRQEAEQPQTQPGTTGTGHSPTPAPVGTPAVTPVSEGQLEAIRHHLKGQLKWKEQTVAMHLKRSEVATVEELGYDEAKLLIGELHSRRGR